MCLCTYFHLYNEHEFIFGFKKNLEIIREYKIKILYTLAFSIFNKCIMLNYNNKYIFICIILHLRIIIKLWIYGKHKFTYLISKIRNM